MLPVPEEKNNAASEVEQIEAELSELAELRGSGEISLAEWMAARRPLLQRLEAVKAAASTIRRPSPAVRVLSEPGAVRRAWPTLDFAARRGIVSALIERITIRPATRGRWTPLTDRVDVTWRV